MNFKKLAVLAAGVAIGELAWTNFVSGLVGGQSEGFGIDDVARYATYAGGILLLQELL